MDVHSPPVRRFNMSRIRGKNTKPELTVRSLVHRMGYRFRLHRKDMPGKPDLVFPSRKKAIFVHGCFWHSHNCPNGRVRPSTRSEFWKNKREETVKRDARNALALKKAGWEVFVVWECAVGKGSSLRSQLSKFLGPRPGQEAVRKT